MPPQDSIYSGKIIINEIHHSAAGNDSRYEFFELYNASEEEINISGWYFACANGWSSSNSTNEDGKEIITKVRFCREHFLMQKAVDYHKEGLK